MIKKVRIEGMTCESCEATVKESISKLDGVVSVSINRELELGVLETNRDIQIQEIKDVLKDKPKYQISEIITKPVKAENEETDHRSWFETYKPVLLIFIYLLVITGLVQLKNSEINIYEWMRHFMAGFFLVFSFFKFLDLKNFAQSYAMYDLIAKKLPIWGYIYALVEFVLGIAYLTDFNPLITNISAFIIMSISIVGVLQSVLNKRKIKCACLGAVFNLPMSTVTIIEDGLMIVMSALMILHHL